ncbi:MAG TPA: hypothetical protein VFQ88_08225 [Nevskiaceae bacterium]|nr:hypothetical protein [Nevskiaceae bacterium]
MTTVHDDTESHRVPVRADDMQGFETAEVRSQYQGAPAKNAFRCFCASETSDLKQVVVAGEQEHPIEGTGGEAVEIAKHVVKVRRTIQCTAEEAL